jgi:hypothetical protein
MQGEVHYKLVLLTVVLSNDSLWEKAPTDSRSITL